jgi:hypothetical protein
MRHLALLAGAIALVSPLVTGCPPPKNDKEKSSPAQLSTPCSKVGQSCELSPGKLGTCVQKDDCKDPAGCFDCQSQH